MPYLSKKRVWTRQPQVAIEIDWSNPITNSLIFASAGNDFAWSNVSGYHLLIIGNGGPKNVPHNSGLLKGFNTNGSGTTDRLVAKEVAFASTGFFSLISHMMPVGYGGGNFARIINPEGSSGVDGTCWASMYNSPGSGNMAVANYPTNAASIFSAGVPGTFTLNEWQSHAYVINLDAITTYPEVYKNGLELSGVVWNGTPPAGVAVSGTATIGIGNRSTDSARYFDGLIGPVLMFQRRLFPSEIKSLHDNPWSVFKKQDKRIWIPSAGGGSSTNLIIQDSTHSLLSDNLDLSTSLLLTIQDSTHSLTSDNLILNTTGSTDLIIQEATHSVTSDNLLITTEWLLDIASAAHALTSDNLDLSTALSIVIQNAIHSHTTDNLVLDTSDTTLLTIQDAVHSHTADNLDLTLDTWLVIANAVHSHLADNINLGTELTLTIQDSTHNLTSDIIILSIPSTGSCPTVEEIVTAIMIQIEAKNYLTLPQFLSFK